MRPLITQLRTHSGNAFNVIRLFPALAFRFSNYTRISIDAIYVERNSTHNAFRIHTYKTVCFSCCRMYFVQFNFRLTEFNSRLTKFSFILEQSQSHKLPLFVQFMLQVFCRIINRQFSRCFLLQI